MSLLRRGQCTVEPGVTLPEGALDRADLQELGTPTVLVGEEAIGDAETAEVPFAKMKGGTRTGSEAAPVVMKMDGAHVVQQSADYVKDTQHFYDGAVTGGSPGVAAINSLKAIFTVADVGGRIEAAVFPVGTTMIAYVSPTQMTTSEVPTESAANLAFVLLDRPAGTGWAEYGDGHVEINNPSDPTAPRSVFRGNLESEGIRTFPDGTMQIGTGPIKLRATAAGDFIFGTGGQIVAITHDGKLYIGGLDLGTAVASFDAAGNFTLKNTAQSNHAISIGAIDFTVLSPQANPPAGAFDANVDVALFSQTQGAAVYYTTDGSTPTLAVPGTLYTGARIALSATTTIKAIAIVGGVFASSVSTFVFTNDATKVPNPEFDPVGGTYTPAGSTFPVHLTCSLVGASISYTLDDAVSPPSPIHGTIVTPASGAVVPATTIGAGLAATRTLRAMAFKAGKTNSDVVTEVYHITAGGGGGGYPGGGGRGNVP